MKIVSVMRTKGVYAGLTAYSKLLCCPDHSSRLSEETCPHLASQPALVVVAPASELFLDGLRSCSLSDTPIKNIAIIVAAAAGQPHSGHCA